MIHVADFTHPDIGSFHIETSDKKALEKSMKEVNKKARKKKIKEPEKIWTTRTIGTPTRRSNASNG